MILLEDICLAEYRLGLEVLGVTVGIGMFIVFAAIVGAAVLHWCEIDEEGNYLHRKNGNNR